MPATVSADKTLHLWRAQLGPRGFDLRRVLARGPGYLTFEARVVLGRERVAVKLFRGHAGRELRQRFQQALERRASLRHAHLLRVQSFGEALGYPFLALELCEAPSLSTRLREGDLGLDECMKVLRGVAAGVDAAARGGVLAREITPDSILVDPVRGGLLGDLGVAQEAVGPVPVTLYSQLPYRPPEELRRQPVDSRGAVYSLGAVLYSVLAGRRPTPQPPSVRRWRPGVPPEIDRVVGRAMADDPETRYRTATGLMRATTIALSTAPRASRSQPAYLPPATPSFSAAPASQPSPRHRVLPSWVREPVPAVAVAIAIVGSGAFGSLLGSGGVSERTTTTKLHVEQTAAPATAVSPAMRALPETIERLGRRRAVALRRLGRATVPKRQARASRQAARAYLAAGRAVGGRGAAGHGLDDLRSAFGRAADAYGKLAGAAATADARRYDAARKSIRRGERAVRRALVTAARPPAATPAPPAPFRSARRAPGATASP